MSTSLSASIVVPTFQREQVLLDTIELLLKQNPAATEILIVDQSPDHEIDTVASLESWHRQGAIRWLRRPEPSIPKSMNYGLLQSRSDIVLFLDDDISISPNLVGNHLAAYMEYPTAVAVAGQVLQPEEHAEAIIQSCKKVGMYADLGFRFNSTHGDWVNNVMAGNLSVRRQFAIAAGGFDENFIGTAYRFETEFARRLTNTGGKIRFYPEATINHLRASRGGTRATGNHLASADPKHGVGDYYFALISQVPKLELLRYLMKRPIREVSTKFHLKHPWFIPVKLLGEWRAFLLARSLIRQGRKLIRPSVIDNEPK